MSVFFLIYVSTAVRMLSDRDLLDIPEVSREKNLRLDITGMLLYKSGSFMQFLEGPKQQVCSLLETIKRDSRHRGVMTLLQQEHSDREFSDWTMGFQQLSSDELLNVPGYSEFLELPLTSEQFLLNPSKSLRLLLNFKNVAL